MKMMGIEFDESKFKKRKGFKNIVVDGEMLQYKGSYSGVVFYLNEFDKIIVTPDMVQHIPKSKEYQDKYNDCDSLLDNCYGSPKPHIAELYRRYKLLKLTTE